MSDREGMGKNYFRPGQAHSRESLQRAGDMEKGLRSEESPGDREEGKGGHFPFSSHDSQSAPVEPSNKLYKCSWEPKKMASESTG